jgi:hypothetical protein
MGGGVTRMFIREWAPVLAGSAFVAFLLAGAIPAQRLAAMDLAGVTIPIEPLAAPLRGPEPERAPAELRPTIRELPPEAPPQRSRKPSRTQFADMDFVSPAG